MALGNFKFQSLPSSYQILISVALAAGLTYVVYLYYFQPMLDERSSLQSDVDKLEVEVAQGAAIAGQLKKFKEEVARLEERLAELSKILPAEKETPIVLRGVQDMASSSNLKILRFIPKPTVPRAFYSDWPIELTVQGSYNSLGKFFEKISQYARIVNVNNISIKTNELGVDPKKTLSAVCTATTFVFREEQAPTGSGN